MIYMGLVNYWLKTNIGLNHRINYAPANPTQHPAKLATQPHFLARAANNPSVNFSRSARNLPESANAS